MESHAPQNSYRLPNKNGNLNLEEEPAFQVNNWQDWQNLASIAHVLTVKIIIIILVWYWVGKILLGHGT